MYCRGAPAVLHQCALVCHELESINERGSGGAEFRPGLKQCSVLSDESDRHDRVSDDCQRDVSWWIMDRLLGCAKQYMSSLFLSRSFFDLRLRDQCEHQ